MLDALTHVHAHSAPHALTPKRANTHTYAHMRTQPPTSPLQDTLPSNLRSQNPTPPPPQRPPVDVADEGEGGSEADGTQHEEEGPAHHCHVPKEEAATAPPHTSHLGTECIHGQYGPSIHPSRAGSRDAERNCLGAGTSILGLRRVHAHLANAELYLPK